MPYANSNGVKLYYEEAGKGVPIVFVHEFSHDLRSWEPQLRYFSRRYRCIAYNARGYPPSDVPAARSAYSQAIAAGDIAGVMRHLGIARAHVIGCSMGGYATLHFGLTYPRMARSLTVIGAGYGSDPDKRAQFLRDTEVFTRRFEELGTAQAIEPYVVGPARVQLMNKDPRAYREFCEMFSHHSALGSANTQRGVQARRPTVYSLERGSRAHEGADPHRERRRGHELPGARGFHQAGVPRRPVDRRAGDRTRRERRRARSLQPPDRRFPRAGRFGALAAAGPAGNQQVDHGPALTRAPGESCMFDRCHFTRKRRCPTPVPRESASTTKKPAAARRSCSCTSSPAISAAGSRRCASSAGASAASRSTRAATRPRKCRRRPRSTRIPSRPTTSAP